MTGNNASCPPSKLSVKNISLHPILVSSAEGYAAFIRPTNDDFSAFGQGLWHGDNRFVKKFNIFFEFLTKMVDYSLKKK